MGSMKMGMAEAEGVGGEGWGMRAVGREEAGHIGSLDFIQV